MTETAQGNALRTLVEDCKDVLESDFRKKLVDLGIQEDSESLIMRDELVQYAVLDNSEEKELFTRLQQDIHDAITADVEAFERQQGNLKKPKKKKKADAVVEAVKKDASKRGEYWKEAHHWFVDRMVYTFLNRVFAIRVMEAFDLLKESTLVPQEDLGNRSARMARIQEQQPGKTMPEWHQLVLRDVFAEISQEVKILFEETDVASRIWPDSQAIEQVIQKLNNIDANIYAAEDIIGWFYHYYVLKTRKGHKTMSSHGSKSPLNPYYLSILNTVYTPRWMVRVLVDNSLGHWWQDAHPESKIFLESPFFIQKVLVQLEYPTKELQDLRILDPACGSGNFLVYTFGKLVEMYNQEYPDWSYTKIVTTIISSNLFGVDINRRPAQLSALALFILAKTILRQKAPAELAAFKMPATNIICCDIRIPHDKNRVLFIQQIKDPTVQKIVKDVVEQFDNADELGSLIDIRSLQAEIDAIAKTSKPLDSFLPKGKQKELKKHLSIDLVKIVDSSLSGTLSQNIGMQLFGKQARNAASLANVLMQKYDIIIGNPPFGLAMDSTKEKLRRFYPNTYGDLVSAFVDQSLRLLKDNGHISMVSDFSFMHLPKFEKFRENILLNTSYIEYLLLQGFKALSDAGNRPVLFILRKINPRLIQKKNTLCRLIKYNLNNSYPADVYYKDMIEDIKQINDVKGNNKLPHQWNQINQDIFLSLPRCVIDLSIAEKFRPLLEFFTKFPRLDISQHNKIEKENLPKMEIARAYKGCDNGHNDRFVRYFFEYHPNEIRRVEPIESIDDIPDNVKSPFIPLSKGGGDIRYYMNNGYVLWWNKASIIEMQKNIGARIQNLSLFGRSEINWSLHSGKPRGRFFLIQKNTGNDSASMSIKSLINTINKTTLIAFLNSKFTCFFT